jgi:glycosyltransferase involved in cell wall biosynthesis
MYGISDNKLHTIYNGIDYDFWNPSTIHQDNIIKLREDYNITNNYVGLYFGRMGMAKGMDDVLKAILEIMKTIPQYKQVFITPKKQSSKIL